jgi:hypothetical protein
LYMVRTDFMVKNGLPFGGDFGLNFSIT